MVSIQAHMDGQQVVVRNIGKKVKVSEMELIIFCNFTKLAILEIFSELDGQEGLLAREEAQFLKAAINRDFSKKGNDGLSRLANSAVAMVTGERFSRYVVDVKD